jgi:hypothetical protein
MLQVALTHSISTNQGVALDHNLCAHISMRNQNEQQHTKNGICDGMEKLYNPK